jgi:nucleolar GTP-binding protein
MIDTPGILDHPLEERNTIEMLSITALAHLRACVLYFMDLSEQCGYSIADQVKLFHNIKPLFANKPLLLIINKIDQRRVEDLCPEDQALVKDVIANVFAVAEISCHNEIGLVEARNLACEKLLEFRVEHKIRSGKVDSILQKIHVALPAQRDDMVGDTWFPWHVSL